MSVQQNIKPRYFFLYRDNTSGRKLYAIGLNYLSVTEEFPITQYFVSEGKLATTEAVEKNNVIVVGGVRYENVRNHPDFPDPLSRVRACVPQASKHRVGKSRKITRYPGLASGEED